MTVILPQPTTEEEFARVIRHGMPRSVFMGCKTEHVRIPGTDKPSFISHDKPRMARNKHGKLYQVMEGLCMERRRWKTLVNDQKRKAAGRWYSGKPA